MTSLRFQVPLNLFITGPSADALNLQTNFTHSRFAVRLNLTGEASRSDDSFPEDMRHFRSFTGLDLHIEEVGQGRLNLAEVGHDPSRHPELVKLLSSIVNRVQRGIRNFGAVPEVNEIHPRGEHAEAYLRKWKVEISEDGENWKRVFGPQDFRGLFSLFVIEHSENHGVLGAVKWPDIVEAIQDNLEPGPEQEFLINAIEHLNRRNYRLAVVESIVCLEIVLNDYLRIFLANEKGIPKDRVGHLLNAEVGLTARVSALLDLTMNRDDLALIERDHVLKAIEWRNRVVHKTGRLPDHLTEADIRQRTNSVFALVGLLAARRDQIKTAPEMHKIGEALSKQHAVPFPNIFKVDRHRVAMQMVFFPFKLPEEETLKAVADDLSSRLKARDTRFEPNRHLSIEYLIFPRRTWARWHNGQLEVLQKTPNETIRPT